jgi:uncharacterized protein YkwD
MNMKKLFAIIFLMFFLLPACGSPTPTKQTTSAQPAQTALSEHHLPTAPVTAIPSATEISMQYPATPSNCIDTASFVADVTVPDNTKFKQGDAIHKVWRVKNSGTCVWNSQYTLVFTSGDQMGALSSTPLNATQPGNTLDIAVDMVAPSKDGGYRGDFELHDPSGAVLPIDQAKTLWLTITVGVATTDLSGTATSAPKGNSGSNQASGPGLANTTCAFTTSSNHVDDVITAINTYRAQNNLPPYTVNAQLMDSAQSYSQDMACNNLFGHTGSNGSTISSRVAATGYSALNVTENVYGSYPPLTGAGAVSWWAADQIDPRHNENLISTEYVEIGVGYSFFNNYGYYVVDFAKPKNLP